MREEMHLYSMKRFYVSNHRLIQQTAISLQAKEKLSPKFLVG
jgi:hypothetical protein